MEQSINFFTFYYSVPENLRIAIILTIILLILRRGVFWLGIRVLAYSIKMTEYFFMILVFIYTFIAGLYIELRLKHNKTNFPVVNSIEGFLQKILNSTVNSYKKFTGRFLRKGIWRWTRKKNLVSALIMAAILTITFNKWPEAKATSSLVEAERWLMENQLDQKHITSERAQELVSVWLEEKTDENSIETSATEPKILQLKQGTSGGKVRAEPSMSGAVLHIAGPNEPMTYLEEKQQNGNILWLKVQTQTNETGWISSNIVE